MKSVFTIVAIIIVIGVAGCSNKGLPSTSNISIEGQSCGENAGAAGNTQCQSGLSCVYNTEQDVINKIGVCAKK